MKRKFNKIFTGLIILVVCACSLVMTSGCDREKKQIEITKMEYSLKEHSNDSDAIDVQNKTLFAGHEYFLELVVDYHSYNDTDGTVTIDGVFRLYNVDNVTGTIEESNSAAAASTLTFVNSKSEQQCQETTVTFKVPVQKNVTKSMVIRVKLTPNFTKPTSNNRASCGASFTVQMTEGLQSGYNITGESCDGKFFTIYVQKTQIAAPVIEIHEDNSITWTCVEYATRYEILVGNEVLNEVQPDKNPGEMYRYTTLFKDLDAVNRNGGSFVHGSYYLTIRAKADDNFIACSSNEIQFDY